MSLPISRGHADFHALPDDQGLFSVIARGNPTRPVLDGRTFAELGADVTALAVSLMDSGVQHGDRVAILGRNSYEWVVADYAALSIGAITVPIYPTASEEQIAHLLSDSGACLGFAETPGQRDQLTRLGDWRSPVRLLADALVPPSGDLARFAERSAAVRADDIATIVYTSGTTGMPKGCVLTHRNMFASSANTVKHLETMFCSEYASTLLALPLSHIFGRSMLLASLFAGTRTGLVAAIPDLFAELPRFRPSCLALVPYALEKIRKRCRGLLDPRAEAVAVEYGMALAHADEVDPALAAEHRELDRTVFATARQALGGRCDHVISGGASLDASTDAFFAGIGVQILGAYGLTEAATAVTINEIRANRHGSVGRPIPGTSVAIAGDDEVLVSGGNVSPGYWPRTSPARSERSPSLPQPSGKPADEWLHTGDLGRIDADGYLYITGRRKEILVTSGGKNVSPTPLEDRVRLHPLVSNCMVVGEARAFVTALVTLDAPALAKWAADRGIPPEHTHPEVLAAVQTAVDEANGLVSRAESIRAFRVLAGDFTVANGQLTASLKLRRAVIEQAYAADVDSLYATQ